MLTQLNQNPKTTNLWGMGLCMPFTSQCDWWDTLKYKANICTPLYSSQSLPASCPHVLICFLQCACQDGRTDVGRSWRRESDRKGRLKPRRALMLPITPLEWQRSLEINHNSEGPVVWELLLLLFYTSWISSDSFTGFSDKRSEGLPVHHVASLKLPTSREAMCTREEAF